MSHEADRKQSARQTVFARRTIWSPVASSRDTYILNRRRQRSSVFLPRVLLHTVRPQSFASRVPFAFCSRVFCAPSGLERPHRSDAVCFEPSKERRLDSDFFSVMCTRSTTTRYKMTIAWVCIIGLLCTSAVKGATRKIFFLYTVSKLPWCSMCKDSQVDIATPYFEMR